MTTRLRNIKTGVIVGVADEKASRLGSEWEVIADEKPAKAAKPAPKPDGK